MSVVSTTAGVPLVERGGLLRGVIDLATCRYPAFVFGGPLGRLLPVFHLHEVTVSSLEPKLRHLDEHGYRTVTSEVIERYVRDGVHPGDRTVALCFDDAHASLWTVAAPLLRRHGFRAVTFAIAGRIRDAVSVRPTIDDSGPLPSTPPGDFVTWPELRALDAGGVIDVQCHGYGHSKIFCHDVPHGFVTPDVAGWHPLDRPLLFGEAAGAYLKPDDLGAPLYVQRSRLSDALRYVDDDGAHERCVAHVRSNGGPSFFDRRGWAAELRALAARGRPGSFETADARRAAIYEDLDRGRAMLRDRLRTNAIGHLCFPWEVAGAIARGAACALGFRTAFSDRLFGLRAVRGGDDPWRLMRLNGKFIPSLPRRRRALIAVGSAGRPAPGRTAQRD